MEKDKVEKVCQLCSKSFKTVRADAKFCCDKHRMKAHRLTKTHVRLVALSGREAENINNWFKGFKISSQVVNGITWGGKQFDFAIYYHVKKEDFHQVFTIPQGVFLKPTSVGKQGLRAFRIKVQV